MKVVTLKDHLDDLKAAQDRAGITFTPEMVDALRNKGTRRTPEKRALLDEIQRRCREAGIEPVVAYSRAGDLCGTSSATGENLQADGKAGLPSPLPR